MIAMTTASAELGITSGYEELVMVLGGMPFCAEYEGHVSFAFPVGFTGQQPPSPKEATLPSAAASFEPAQLD